MTKLVRLAVSGVLLGWIAWHTDWDRLAEAFAHLHAGWWLAALGVLLVTQLISAWRWQLFASVLGFRRTYREHARYYWIGMYFNLLLPTSVGGDVVRAWYLDGGAGRYAAALGTVLLDRLSGLVVLLALACGAVAVSPQELPGWIAWLVWSCAGGTALGLVLLPLISARSVRIQRKWQQVQTALATLRAPRLLVTTTLLSLLVQAANVGICWLVVEALSVRVPAAYLCIVVPMVSLLTMLPISVNGMGVREGAMVLFLAPLGIDRETAVSLALAWFAVSLAASLMGGGVYLCGDRLTASECRMPSADTEGERHGPVDRDSDQGRARQLETAA